MPKNLITHKPSFSTLGAEVEFWRVVLVGLGAMVGAGIFVGVGIAAGIADRYLILALVLVAILAVCSGLNSIQLSLYYALCHPLPFKRSTDDGGDGGVQGVRVQGSRGQGVDVVNGVGVVKVDDVDVDVNVNVDVDVNVNVDVDVYGYSNGLLNAWIGFVAALSLAFSHAATAAAASLGVAGYALTVLGMDPIWLVPIAIVIIVALTGFRLVGLHPSRSLFRVLTVGSVAGWVALGVFAIVGIVQALMLGNSSGGVINGLGRGLADDSSQSLSTTPATLSSWFKAASLMVIAYGGYERMAAFVNPLSRSIPSRISPPYFVEPDPDPPIQSPVKALPLPRHRFSNLQNPNLQNISGFRNTGLRNIHQLSKAMIVTIALVTVLYGSVAIAAISAVGSDVLSDSVTAFAAPLAVASWQLHGLGSPMLVTVIVAVGAMLALLGITGYLLTRLSRVLWTMGRRRDLPKVLGRVDATTTIPNLAWVVAAGMIACIALTSDIESMWSFGAFALLLHMAIINLAALRLASSDRLYPRWMSWMGLGLSVFLIPWLEWRIWLMGLGLVVIGLIWRGINLWSAEQAGG